MHKRKNLYLVLDLTPQCSQNEILHAYNRAKTTYSRDSLAAYSLYDDNAKEGILKEIEDAYFVLGDPRKRRAYDLSMGFAQAQSNEQQDALYGSAHSSHTASGPGQGPNMSTIRGPKKKLEITPQIIVERNPAFEEEINTTQILTGSMLRSTRIYRGYTEDQLASLCQLKTEHILAMEEERPLNMHHPVYLRGHLMLICEALQIPRAAELVKTYIERLQQEEKLARVKSI